MPGVRDRASSHQWRNLALSALVCAAVTLVVCGRSLGRGLYLYRDFVTVPDPVWGASTWGHRSAPRAVPLDPVMTAVSGVVPTGVQQQAMLLGTVFLAGLGVAVLLRRRALPAMLAGAIVAMWNPYVAERLLVGQPPTLLAYSMAPWLVAVVRSRLGTGVGLVALLVSALPAALTPFGGLTASGLVLATSLATTWRRTTSWLAGCLGLAVAWCLPWVVPALAGGASAGADPDGAGAFAAASDSPLGVFGSALTLGGIWASGAQPASKGGAAAVIGASLLALIALAGLVLLLRRGRDGLAVVLGASWLLPPTLAWALSTGPGLSFFAAAQSVPGVALLRDTHRWLGLSALALSLLCGITVCELGTRSRGRWLASPPWVVPIAGALVVASLAALTAPDLPRLVRAAYQPVAMPTDWEATVRAASSAAGDDGTVVVLPWQPFRQVAWAGPQPFLDPLDRALRQQVLGAHELRVVRGGQVLTVDDDPPRWRSLGEGEANVEQLRAAGVDAVVVWKGTRGTVPPLGAEMQVVLDGPDFAVWSLTRR